MQNGLVNYMVLRVHQIRYLGNLLPSGKRKTGQTIKYVQVVTDAAPSPPPLAWRRFLGLDSFVVGPLPGGGLSDYVKRLTGTTPKSLRAQGD
jgi:hypothetical protein